MMSFQPPLFLNQWSSLQKTSMGRPDESWGWNPGNSFKWWLKAQKLKGISWTGVSQALCALPLAAMGYVGVAQWILGSLIWLSEATGVFQNSNDAGAERCCFQKHPKLTTFRKIKFFLQLGTWTLWRKSLKSSIQNNKSCVWKKRAMNFFFEGPNWTFSKKVGVGVFSWHHICNFQFAYIFWNGPRKLDAVQKKRPCLDWNDLAFQAKSRASHLDIAI